MSEHDSLGSLHWETDAGLPTRVTAADGTVWITAQATSSGTRLHLRRPDGGEIVLALDAAEHPVLGPCDAIERPDGTVLALGSRVDWRRPTSIPALDRPGALPGGAGTAILNLLAWQAQHSGTGPLRYAGPYPSPALFHSLLASFELDEDPELALSRFVADAETRALNGTRGEIAVDFRPAPHTWAWPSPRVCVQHRAERVERVYVDGRAFDRSRAALRRLVPREDSLVALIALGEQAWCERLRLSPEGVPLGEPRSPPAGPESLVGSPLPDAVSNVLGEVVLARAPRLLHPGMRVVLDATTLRWGDTGDELVAWNDDGLELHAGMVPSLPTDSTTLLGVLLALVEPPLRRAAARALDAAWSARETSPPSDGPSFETSAESNE